MAVIDLLTAIERLGDGAKLANVKVYGRLVGELKRPHNLYTNVGLLGGSGAFMDFHVFAVDLSAYKPTLEKMGLNTTTSIYMVNGHLMLYTNRAKYTPNWYCCEGIVRYGNKDKFPYLTMFKFEKNNGRWEIAQNELTAFDTTTWDVDSVEFDYMKRSMVMGTVVIPRQADNLPKFYAEPNLVSANTKAPNTSVAVYETYTRGGVFEDVSVFTPENRATPLRNALIEEHYNRTFELAVNATQAKDEFLKSLVANFERPTLCNSYIHYMYDAILSNLRRKTTSQTYTGKSLLKKYLSYCFPYLASKQHENMTVGEYVCDCFEEIVEYIYNGESLFLDGDPLKLVYEAFGDVEKCYAFICAEIFGISKDAMLEAEETCFKHRLSFSRIFNENPFVLQCIGGLTYDNVETIALGLGVTNKPNLQPFKNIALLDSYINNKDNGSTVFSLDYLSTHSIGLSLTDKQYEACRQSGTYLSDLMLSSIKTFVKDINRSDCKIDLTTFTKIGLKYAQKMSRDQLNQAINNYTQIGLGILMDNRYLTSYALLKKELLVFDYMYKLGQEETGYTDQEIDEYIDEYEQEIGFKLEPEQRQAVHLIKYKAACVAGSAGSGKTTVSNCFTYVLRKLEDNALVFKYATPTGKAAKRLQEVVKQPVKTMCSMFSIFQETESIFDVAEEDEEGYNECYILDENAMVTIDLLYRSLLSIKNSRIYLFGDTHQLPPIGKGLPFKNLLRILPCQFLTVSKRAAEGSGITLNSNYINEFSNKDNWRHLETTKDFILAPCSEAQLVDWTIAITKYYLKDPTALSETELSAMLGINQMPYINNLSPDDIQVVTPLAKSTYTWGANNLNTVLQPIFNKEKSRSKTCFYQPTPKSPKQKYVVGDRVLHTNKNLYSMQWYASCKDGKMQKRYGFGINNGDVGKIVGFIQASKCEFLEEIDEKPSDTFDYPKNLRDDSTFCYDEDNYFLIVKYYDYMSESDFYILYRCQANLEVDDSEGLVLKGEDFNMLTLFYAGTCHKMQGSQTKLLIAPLGVVRYTGFITRNMMYTVYTRATDCVITIGSVDNTPYSMLSKARRVVSEANVLTVGELLCRTDDESV